MGISIESGVVVVYIIRQIVCAIIQGKSVWNEFLNSGLKPEKAMVFSIYIISRTITIFLSTSQSSIILRIDMQSDYYSKDDIQDSPRFLQILDYAFQSNQHPAFKTHYYRFSLSIYDQFCRVFFIYDIMVYFWSNRKHVEYLVILL